MFLFPELRLAPSPFPHAVVPNFLPDALYADLRRGFPDCPANLSPTGYSLFREDDAYQRLVQSNAAWRTLHEAVHGQSYLDWCGRQFAADAGKQGCRIDLSAARYADHVETRTGKVTRDPVDTLNADELFVRLDIAQAKVDYENRPHTDHCRRAVTLLIYFSDGDECDMDGGDLLLFENRGRPRPTVTVRPRHNLAVAFPCSPRSVHAVTRIRRANAPRNHVQVQLSALHDLWPSNLVAPQSRVRLGRGIYHALAAGWRRA